MVEHDNLTQHHATTGGVVYSTKKRCDQKTTDTVTSRKKIFVVAPRHGWYCYLNQFFPAQNTKWAVSAVSL